MEQIAQLHPAAQVMVILVMPVITFIICWFLLKLWR
jgi:hypothetical protein